MRETSMDDFVQSATNTSHCGTASDAFERGASNVRTPPLSAILDDPVSLMSASPDEYSPESSIRIVAGAFSAKNPPFTAMRAFEPRRTCSAAGSW